MLDQLTTLLLALGGWAVVLVASVKWVADRVAQRMSEQWTRNRELELEQFRAMSSQSQSVMDAALAAFGAGHDAARERQLVALEVLWKGVVTLRTQAPPLGVLADVLSDEEFASLNERRELLRNHVPQDIPAETLKLMSSVLHVEEQRPFCGELAWALFHAYRNLYGRLLMIFDAGVREGRFVPWRQDRGIQHILKSVLDTEDYSRMMAGSFGGWFSTCELIEAKLVAEIQAVISGEHAANTGLAAATRILEAVQTAKRLNSGNSRAVVR